MPKDKTFFKRIKIKYQLFILVVITIIFMTIIPFTYWVNFYNLTEANSELTTSNLLTQLEENITIRSDTIIQAGNVIAYNEFVQQFMSSTDYVKRAEYIKFIQSLFQYIQLTNSNIQDIILADDLGNITNSITALDWSLYDQIDDLYEDPSKLTKGKGLFNAINYNDTYFYIYTLPFKLFQKPSSTQFCYIVFRNDSLQHLMTGIELTKSSLLYLVNSDNTILAANDSKMLGSQIDTELQNLITNENLDMAVDYKNNSSYIKCQQISDINWTLISIVPVRELTSPLDSLRNFSLIFGAFIIIVMIAICIMIINNITRPINQLSTFMEDVSYTTLKSNLPTTGANEIDQVIINVNSMLRQIEALTHKIFTNQGEYYEMELAKKNAEFFALQNQINPHFLYNTLDCIRSIAFSYNADEIVSISSSMSKIFRYCIKSENLVTVQDELACVNNYINIIQVRYDNRFNIEQDIDEGLLTEKIIKFLLQPLIENAIYHGLELKAGPGTLRIIGKKLQDNEFEFEIYDTGVGIEPGTLTELNHHLDDPDYIDDQNHTGVGLVNINWRIKNVFGEKYGLHIESQKNEWTKVTLLLSRLPENYH